MNGFLRNAGMELEEWKAKYHEIENDHTNNKIREEKSKKSGAQEKQYLQSELNRLSEELKHAHFEIENLRTKKVFLKNINI